MFLWPSPWPCSECNQRVTCRRDICSWLWCSTQNKLDDHYHTKTQNPQSYYNTQEHYQKRKRRKKTWKMGSLRGSQQMGQSRTSGSKSVTEREESLLEEICLVVASSITTSRSLSSLVDSIRRSSSSSSSSPELPAVSSSSSMEGSRCRLRDWWLLDPSPSSPPEIENLAIFLSDQIYAYGSWRINKIYKAIKQSSNRSGKNSNRTGLNR